MSEELDPMMPLSIVNDEKVLEGYFSQRSNLCFISCLNELCSFQTCELILEGNKFSTCTIVTDSRIRERVGIN